MLTVQEAEAIIFKLVQPFDSERDIEFVDLKSSLNRILAKSIASKLDFPHWDNSAMDGYAVRFEDVAACSTDRPAVLNIIEEIPAGSAPQKIVQLGQAARILTGSMMPDGADTIVMQEDTDRNGNHVSILSPPKNRGAFVRYRGAYYQAGQELLPAGIVLNPPEIAVLAAAQCVQVPVFRRPRVAILSTGNELATPNQPLQPGQIVDSNQFALEALIAQMNAEPISIGIVRDDPDALKQAISEAIGSADVVISSGGVSVGDYDYVDRILAELGADIHIRSIRVKPGKPLTFATFSNSTLYFGLPGNPVSALVTFWRFVDPAIRKLSGLTQNWKPAFVTAINAQDLKSDGKRETYLWGRVSVVDGAYQFSLAGGQQISGNLINLAQTNALGVMSIDTTHLATGAPIQVLRIEN